MSAKLIVAQSISWNEITSNFSLPSGIKVFKGTRITPKLEIFYIDADMNNSNLVIHPYITNPNKTVKDFVPVVGAYAGINGGFLGGTTSYSAVVYPEEVKAINVPTVTRNSTPFPVIRSFFGMNYNKSFNVQWIYHYGNNVEDVFRFDEPMPYNFNQTNPLPAPDQSSGSVYQNLLVGIGGAPTLVKNNLVNVTYNQEIMWGSGVGYDNSDPRTAVGYTSNNHVIFITADGRQSQSLGVGLPELAQILVDLGCVEAMNLDGGGSTQMAIGNQYVNSPSENRVVPTMLAITHKDSLHLPNIPRFEKIIDTADPEAMLFGEGWFESSNPGFWDTTKSQLNPIGIGTDYAKFTPTVITEAEYEVYAWWVAASNRCQNSPFLVTHKNGVDTIIVNQTLNGSQWNLIGSFYFSQDSTQNIIISDNGTLGSYIVADAIKLISYDPATSVENENRISPVSFKLYQNYPNPFNPSSVIRYEIPENSYGGTSKVLLRIFDILGNEITTLVNEEQSPGIYEINFDALSNNKALATGLYFYQLKTNDFIKTKKMIYLK